MTVTAAKRRPAKPLAEPEVPAPVDETSNLRRTNAKPEPRSAASAETLTPGQREPDTQSIRAGGQLASGQGPSESQTSGAAGNQLTPGQNASDTQTVRAGDQLASGQGTNDTYSAPAAGNTLIPGQPSSDTQTLRAGDQLTPGHGSDDTQAACAGDHLASGQVERGNQESSAAGNPLTPGQRRNDTQSVLAGGHLDGELLFYAAMVDDIEDLRERTANRALALAKEGAMAAEHERQVKAFADLEHQAVLHLQRAMRKHPYAPWVKQTLGVGEKQGARLLAAIGDPYWNAAEGRPRRGPAELWAYCGYAPGQKRQKGVKANWNAEAKMRAFLVAEKCLNTGVRKLDGYDDTDGYDFENRVALTPHAQVYLDARRSWADRDTSEGHKHNHALRRVAKEVLKDLWRFGRDLEESA